MGFTAQAVRNSILYDKSTTTYCNLILIFNQCILNRQVQGMVGFYGKIEPSHRNY